MIKILGSILILSASIFACYTYEKHEKRSLDSLKELCSFIKHIKSKIEYFSMPLDRIYMSYEEKSPLISSIIENGFESVKAYFNKTELNILLPFFSSIGNGFKKEEVCLCDYTICELEKIIESKSTEYPNKIKAFRAIALFCGFCMVILLI